MLMTDTQKNIYDGLKSIGEEISSFYNDALNIIDKDDLVSQSYLLAHIAREIDGGLRDILSPLSAKEELQKDPSLKNRGNAASILVALDLKLDDPFALKYIEVSSKFQKYAHRRGATKAPRNPTEVIQLWKEYEAILLKLVGSFINQLNRIERIAKFEEPTNQILEALKNMFSDKQKERHFYINLKKVSWLKPLYNKGFFSPEYILDDLLWNQAEYLEFISKEIKDGAVEEQYSKLLIKIIEEINQYSCNIRKLENYRIWYFLIDIMTNLPKKFITDSIIDDLPKYFYTRYENNLQSEAIFKFIYSFFEEEKVALDNKQKIEKLIELIFRISDQEVFQDRSTYETGKYFPVIRAYRLTQACQNPILYTSIPLYCSNRIIFYIADNLLTYLKASYISGFWIKSLFDLDKTEKQSYSIEVIYTIFLQNTCVEIAKLDDQRIKEIIQSFLSKRYKHKHFIKLSFFLFAKTWNISRSLFFELIRNQDERKVFSETFWADDLYFMLEEIAIHLNKKEAHILREIIDNGSQNDKYYNKEKYLDEYKLLWLSSLNASPYFKNDFEELSERLNKTKQSVTPKLERNITIGSISPISKKDMINLPTAQLIKTLKEFDPKRGFREPCVEGLARALQDAIKENPNLFSENYTKFLKVPYHHISEIYSGLSETWKNEVQIDWKSCIRLVDEYTVQSVFGSNKLELQNTSYKFDHFSVIRSFCRLLSAGMRDDRKSFDLKLLPLAEKIIFRFITNYISNELPDSQLGKLGSAMYVINSTTGVIIGTLIDYSLRKARLSNIKGQKETRWADKERAAYEKLIEYNIQEFYMYLGWHRNQFYFLDFTWTERQLESIPDLQEQTIKSYFGGHLLTYPSSEFEYKTFKKIYSLAIKQNWKIEDSTMGENPVEVHATIFYIFDFEDLKEGDIITQILEI